MEIRSLGKINVASAAGAAVQVTADDTLFAHEVIFSVIRANTGVTYVGLTGLNKTTKAAVITELPVPANGDAVPFRLKSPDGNRIQLSKLFVHASVDNEGLIASYTVA